MTWSLGCSSTSTCFHQHRSLEPGDPQALSTAGPRRDVLSAKHTPDRQGCMRRMWNGSGIHLALLGYIGQNKLFHPFSKWLLENLKFPKWLASCFTAPSFIQQGHRAEVPASVQTQVPSPTQRPGAGSSRLPRPTLASLCCSRCRRGGASVPRGAQLTVSSRR